jgi:hypothetical protein
VYQDFSRIYSAECATQWLENSPSISTSHITLSAARHFYIIHLVPNLDLAVLWIMGLSKFFRKVVTPVFLKVSLACKRYNLSWTDHNDQDDGFNKILRAAADATPGVRAWSKRNTVIDQEVGMRWDWGEKVIVDGRLGRNLVLQANKGARQEVLRQMAGRNSHGKLMTICLDLKDPMSVESFLSKWGKGLEKY